MVLIQANDMWIIGANWLSYVFTTVDLQSQTIMFARVSVIDRSLPGNFDTVFGLEMLIGICVGSIIIYLLAVVIYVIIKNNIKQGVDIKNLDNKYQKMFDSKR